MKRNVFIICSFILALVLSISVQADSSLIIDWEHNGKSNSYVSSSLAVSYSSEGVTVTGQGSEVNVWSLDLTGLDYISFDVLASDTNTTSLVPTVTVSEKEYFYNGSIEPVNGIRTTFKLYLKDFINQGDTFVPSSNSAIRFKFQSNLNCDLTIGDVYGGSDEGPTTTTTATTTTTTGEGLTVDYIASAGFGVLDHILRFVGIIIPVAILIICIFIGIKYAIDLFKGGTK